MKPKFVIYNNIIQVYECLQDVLPFSLTFYLNPLGFDKRVTISFVKIINVLFV